MSGLKVVLRKGREQAVLRKHPWVFSGAVSMVEREIEDGETVDVFSSDNRFLGSGHWQNGSIAVRLLSFEPCEFDQTFWENKIRNAYNLRLMLALAENTTTTVFRLIHGEGDGLPGLVVDVYEQNIVIQAHSVGMHMSRNFIADALKVVFADRVQTIYYKSADTLPKLKEEVMDYFILGNQEEAIVKENGNLFRVNWVKGQKTGFFVDQRDNRFLLGNYSKGKKVLNTYCYTGGFSISALKSGAVQVDSVDSSKIAIELTNRNVELNTIDPLKHRAFAVDTITYLQQMEEKYDVIVLDPPAFAKHLNVRHNAVQGYKRLNALALKKISSPGILFTFSCSQVVDRQLFEDTIHAAAIESGRSVRVLHHLSQPADHPVSIYHPEGEYLKGLVLAVD